MKLLTLLIIIALSASLCGVFIGWLITEHLTAFFIGLPFAALALVLMLIKGGQFSDEDMADWLAKHNSEN